MIIITIIIIIITIIITITTTIIIITVWRNIEVPKLPSSYPDLIV